MYCKRCGNYIDESDTIICNDCLTKEQTEQNPNLNYSAFKKSVLLYFILFVVGALVSMMIAGMLYTLLNPTVIVDPNNLTPEYEAFVYNIQQILTYLLITTVSIIVLKQFIKIDWDKIKTKLPQAFLHGFIGWIFVLLAAVAAGYILVLLGITEESSNQTGIVNLVKSEYGYFMVIVTIFFAPVVEELIFRKAIIDGLERAKRVSSFVAILLSSLLFASIHIVNEAALLFSGESTIQESLLGLAQILPYLLMGTALGFVYKKANNNVFIPMIAHFFQNAFSMLVTLEVIQIASIVPFCK